MRFYCPWRPGCGVQSGQYLYLWALYIFPVLLNVSPDLRSGVSHPLRSPAQKGVGPTGAHHFLVIALLGRVAHTKPPRRLKALVFVQLLFCYHLFVRSEGDEHVHEPKWGLPVNGASCRSSANPGVWRKKQSYDNGCKYCCTQVSELIYS